MKSLEKCRESAWKFKNKRTERHVTQWAAGAREGAGVAFIKIFVVEKGISPPHALVCTALIFLIYVNCQLRKQNQLQSCSFSIFQMRWKRVIFRRQFLAWPLYFNLFNLYHANSNAFCQSEKRRKDTRFPSPHTPPPPPFSHWSYYYVFLRVAFL